MAILENKEKLDYFILEDYEAASDELVRSNIAKFKRVILKQLAQHARTNESAILDINDPNFNEVLKATVDNIFTAAGKALFDNDILSLQAYNSFGETIAEYYFIQDEDDEIYQVFICEDDGIIIRDYFGRLQLSDTAQPVCVNSDGSPEYELLVLSFKIMNHLKFMISGEDNNITPLTKITINYATDELKVEPYKLDSVHDMKRFAEIVKNSGFSMKKSHPILSILEIG
jgi:hypothetical protein